MLSNEFIDRAVIAGVHLSRHSDPVLSLGYPDIRREANALHLGGRTVSAAKRARIRRTAGCTAARTRSAALPTAHSPGAVDMKNTATTNASPRVDAVGPVYWGIGGTDVPHESRSTAKT